MGGENTFYDVNHFLFDFLISKFLFLENNVVFLMDIYSNLEYLKLRNLNESLRSCITGPHPGARTQRI